MSTTNDEEHLDPNNPMSYAPRWMREEAKSRAEASDDSMPELPKRSVAVSLPNSFDVLLKEAISKSLRHPLDPETVQAPAGLGQWRELFPVAARFAAAIGVSTLVALFFVYVIPASREHAQDSNASGVLQSLTAAFHKQAPREAEAKPATTEVQTILAANRAAQPAGAAMTHEQSEALLHQFVQWQQKLDSTSAPPQ
jgi:hypothetical protein